MSYYIWSILSLGVITAIKQAVRKGILEAEEEKRRRWPTPVPPSVPSSTDTPLPQIQPRSWPE